MNNFNLKIEKEMFGNVKKFMILAVISDLGKRSFCWHVSFCFHA